MSENKFRNDLIIIQDHAKTLGSEINPELDLSSSVIWATMSIVNVLATGFLAFLTVIEEKEKKDD